MHNCLNLIQRTSHKEEVADLFWTLSKTVTRTCISKTTKNGICIRSPVLLSFVFIQKIIVDSKESKIGKEKGKIYQDLLGQWHPIVTMDPGLPINLYLIIQRC